MDRGRKRDSNDIVSKTVKGKDRPKTEREIDRERQKKREERY